MECAGDCKGDTPFYGAMALHSPGTCCLAHPGFADVVSLFVSGPQKAVD